MTDRKISYRIESRGEGIPWNWYSEGMKISYRIERIKR